MRAAPRAPANDPYDSRIWAPVAIISGGAASVRNVTRRPPGVPPTAEGSGPVDGICTMTRSARTKVAKTRKMRKAVWRCLLREAEAETFASEPQDAAPRTLGFWPKERSRDGVRTALFRDDSRHLKDPVLEDERVVVRRVIRP